MKEFFQTLQDAFPILRNHPVLMARLTLGAIVLVALYFAKIPRKKLCDHFTVKLDKRIFSTDRMLWVYQNSNYFEEFKYYTSEVTGSGRSGDDMIWTWVRWPSLRPKDSFKLHGVVGTVGALHESQAKLLARWRIVHDPDKGFIGPVPARGLRSVMRRATAKVLRILGSSL